MTKSFWGSRLFALALTASAAALLAGCDDNYSTLSGGPGRSLTPIPGDTIALMQQKDTTPAAPVLIRAYKKEAELEIWKMKSDGRYTLLKTFPMCRWSGQLGPKVREGDMQVPEGFYTITPGQMNPNSHYYLSFNVGYPNAFDRAWGRNGGNVMVHGVCSSAGCFSMTDAQVAEIYAIAREAFNGGQREIQMQSYPFHMTAENLAKFRFDPNIDFWKQLKVGADHFEVTKLEPKVGVCAKRYVFDATAQKGVLEASSPCPALQREEDIEQAVAEKAAHDEAEVAELIRKGVKPIRIMYADGGQNPYFRPMKIADVSDPEALAAGPTEIELDDHGRAIPAVVKVAAADSSRATQPKPAAPEEAQVAKAAATAPALQAPAAPAPQPAQSAAAAPANSPFSAVFGAADSGGSMVKKWLSFGSKDPAPNDVNVYEPAEPVPSDVPLPPRRNAALTGAPKPQASLARGAPHVADASASPLLTLAASTRATSR
jgi:murein L,D-transpeptidase YafK